MAWAKVDDGWWSHPKVLGLSLEARGLWISALSWSCAQRRDVVPDRFVRMLDPEQGEATSNELVEAGLWDATEDGFRIHDWAEYQELTLSEKRAEAGRKGGVKSGQTRSKTKQTGSKPKQTDRSNGEANVEAGTQPGPTQPNPNDSQLTVALPATRPSPAAPTNGQRNVEFEAVCAALDLPLRGDDERMVGMIAGKAIAGGHGPEEIFRRAALHLATFNFPLTPGSFHKRWDQLGSSVVTATDEQRKTAQRELARMQRRARINAEEEPA